MPHLTMPDWLPGETGPPSVPSWEARTAPTLGGSEQTDTERPAPKRIGQQTQPEGVGPLQGKREKRHRSRRKQIRRADPSQTAGKSAVCLDKREVQIYNMSK
jgi:hypothetical protein